MQEQKRLEERKATIPKKFIAPFLLQYERDYDNRLIHGATQELGTAELELRRADIAVQESVLDVAQREVKLASEIESMQRREISQAEKERLAKQEAELAAVRAAQKKVEEVAWYARCMEEQRRGELESIRQYIVWEERGRQMAARDGYTGGI